MTDWQRFRFSIFWTTIGVIAFATNTFTIPVFAAEPVLFNRDIRPILSENCFYCHGPDEKHREGELRLDTSAGATAPLGDHAAVVPHKPDLSALLKRVSSNDPDEQMPPPKSKKPKLSEQQVATLRKWIEQGAEYEGHWAFLPLRTAPPPTVQEKTWAKNPIDQFIFSRLEREHIQPSPAAEKTTLLRRVFLDLIGLLPTPEESRDFLNDTRPDAYEKLVERLLASPHYGERWGRHWLDQARYADSHGYSIDGEREMWPYRDWVIRAFNDDLPFDRFTIEQLAGDLLPKPTKSQLVATGFHRNTLINQEGGSDREQFRVEAVVDRVNTTGAVWLGLTVGCAQCHSHKFDPIAQREYYGLFAFFNQCEDANDKGPTVEVTRGEMFGHPVVTPTPEPTPPPAVELAKTQAAWEKTELARLEKATATGTAKPKEVQWTPAKYEEYDTATGAGFMLLEDNSLLSDGRGAYNDTYRVAATTTLKTVAAVRLRVLTHDSLPQHGPGRASNGNFVLTEFALSVDGQAQGFASAVADHEQANYPVSGTIDNQPKTGWAINVDKGSNMKMNANHEAVFVLTKPIAVGEHSLEIKLHHDLNQNYLVGRFAIDFSEQTPGPAASDKGKDQILLSSLKIDVSKRTDEQKKLVRESFEKAKPNAKNNKAKNPNLAEAMVLKETAKTRDTYLLTKGDFTRPNKELGKIPPGVLQALSSKATEAGVLRTRLDLANWLVGAENPLTPRVTMNRVWLRYFGRGLVETEEDFGTQGTPPSHPELLDWLATEFRNRGWSLKAMHRLIVTSATYRQSSHARPDLAEIDPRNLLLARQERLRCEAEVIRDATLSASGLLDRTIGGPSVHPPQPDGVFSFTQNVKQWKIDTGADRYRRGMYTFFYRSSPHPLFSVFDVPDLQTVCTRRGRSNTPLQALLLANDAGFFELTQALASRVLRETAAKTPETSNLENSKLDEQIRTAFQLCLCRTPTDKELSILSKHYDRRLIDFKNDGAAAKKIYSGDISKLSASLPEVAALVSTCRILLNSDAFITRE